MAEKLVGKDYITPDIVAKVTGKAKYTEDFRADGMLWAKLLVSPMPHARVTRLDTSRALAMPGVKAILTADELPPPAASVTDAGVVIQPNLKGEAALTNEPLYVGEPILAVAAVDEQTAAEAIEAIEIEFEALPFSVDPLASLKPSGPSARTDGNIWKRFPPVRPGGGPPPTPTFEDLKWTDADFSAAAEGQMPMGATPEADVWTYGDLEAGFKDAALVLDESFMTANVSHQVLESRTAMAYWQNGKVHMYTGTQSTVQTVLAIARWLNIPPTDVVYISEYTGGGFGSKVTAGITLVIPALLSKKVNAPVMMRITRADEHSIGGARPAQQGRVKAGFAKDGRLVALDMFVVQDNGPYEWQFDVAQGGRIASHIYQPLAMRYRSVAVQTNTPPRRTLSQPGGMQAVAIIEPVLAKAARKLGIDEVEIHRINAPEGKAKFGPEFRPGQRAYTTSAFVKEAIAKGEETFNWKERKARSGVRTGTKVRGVGMATSAFIAGSVGFDGLAVIRPDGRLYLHSGIGNLGTHCVMDVHRVTAEILGMPWDQCEVVWGDSSKHLPWTSITGGSQTTHAMTRAAHAVGMQAKALLQELASKTLGGQPGSYTVADGKISGNGRSMTFAQAAQKAIELGGKFDGHEPPENINAFTKRSVAALAGQGFVAAARDTYKHDGQTLSNVASFAEVEVDLETGKFHLVDFLVVGDVGTVVNPRSLHAQLLGRSTLGIAHTIGHKWVFDQQYGVPLATRFYQNKPPTILDLPLNMQAVALDIADPETPVGARGVGEPPVGGAAASVVNALAAAIGDDIIKRMPATLDGILLALEAGGPLPLSLTANI